MAIVVQRVQPGEPDRDVTRLAVVFPAYNEEEHVAEAVAAALGVGAGHVVCVNDCSTDNTGSIVDGLAADGRVEAIHHQVNQGKQAAVKHGLAAAVAHADADVIAVLDADMQDDPALLPALCHHVGPYDLVIGCRGRGDMPRIRRLANVLANAPYRLIAGIGITDVQSGYRIYARQVAEYLARHLAVKGGYTLEHTSMLLFGKLARTWGREFKIAEINVPYTYEGAQSSIGVKDNLQLTWASIYHAWALARLRR
ncbi:MAG: glycosyltransferase family 2 protein [Candidatus Brocadiae bacterium]|nr:glycosyltransferase family 2 protein [Candidatus Brocadiia bacterium]